MNFIYEWYVGDDTVKSSWTIIGCKHAKVGHDIMWFFFFEWE